MISRSRQLKKYNTIRCINIVDDDAKKRFGQECGYRLATRNSRGEIAGIFVCRHCRIQYEVLDNILKMIGKWNREKRKFDLIEEI